MLRIIFVMLVLDLVNSFIQKLPPSFPNNHKSNPLIMTGDNQENLKSLQTKEYQNDDEQNIPGKGPRSYHYYNKRNSQSHNVFRLKETENSNEIRSQDNQNNRDINSFGGYNQNRRQHSLKLDFGQNLQQSHSLGSHNTLFSDCNATSNILFIRKPVQDTFQAPNYLPPLPETTTAYKEQEYLPPKDRWTIIIPTKQPSTVTKHPYYTTNRISTRKYPFYTWTSTSTMTTNPYYRPMQKHITTKAPFYIPVTKPPTSTYNITDSYDAKMNEYDPAKAMKVPFEDDDVFMAIPATNNKKPDPTTGPATEVNVVLKQTTPKMTRPIDGVGSERGDVPDNYDDLATTNTMESDNPAPAMANLVPTEPQDETHTTKSPTTLSTTTRMTTLVFSNVTIKMATLDDNRHIEEESTTQTNKTLHITTPISFKGKEFLPPRDITSSTTESVSFSTAPNTKSTAGELAPPAALAMNVPTEPEDVPITIPTLTSTTLPHTTMPTPENNRHLIVEESAPTTPIHLSTTVIPFQGNKYLPAKGITSIPVVTVSSAVGPATAMDVPPEPEDLPTFPPSTSTTLTDTFRAAASSSTITPSVPDTNPFKAPKAPPPRPPPPTTGPSPLPAIAMKVPPEPECDPNSDNPKIDQRSFFNDPCFPNTPKPPISPPFKRRPYLPPVPKTRVERSSNYTLSLSDLEGTPRPVWYAGVYKKTTEPPYPICGGSIVREDVVISAAHCFWDDRDGLQSADLFAVAARKVYKRFDHPEDKRAQNSDVVSIKIPPRFLGARTSFQDDIAVLKLATPFTFTPSVSGLRPICVDFDVDFDRQQMKNGHMGTVAGWGYTDASGTSTRVLQWLELPYVEIEKCILNSEQSFLKYITCDKVCAGENDTGKALCRGDSGGGLAFWQGTPARATPFLRGVASTAPARGGAECNVFAYASFTHVRAHRTFLRDLVPDIEECRFWE